MDDLKSVLDDAHSHELLSVVPAMHHETVGQSLNNGALGLPEPLDLVPASRVGQVLGMLVLDGNIILKPTLIFKFGISLKV